MADCKTGFVRVPFISRPWRRRENITPRIFEITSFTSPSRKEPNKNAKIKGAKII